MEGMSAVAGEKSFGTNGSDFRLSTIRSDNRPSGLQGPGDPNRPGADSVESSVEVRSQRSVHANSRMNPAS